MVFTEYDVHLKNAKEDGMYDITKILYLIYKMYKEY